MNKMQTRFSQFGQIDASKILCICISVLFLGSAVADAKCFQGEADGIPVDVKAKPDNQEDQEDQTAEEEPVEIIDTAVQPEPPSMADDQIKLHMWDGSIVGGKVSVSSINVLTEFGQMTIPIKQIVEFYPGLDSFPQKQAELKMLVENLGDPTYQVREDAHKALVKIGLPLKKEILKFTDGGSIERKKHLVEIRKELEELQEDIEDLDEPSQIRDLTQQDRVVTPNMTVVGKIQEELFVITSKFGELKVRLEDIEHASRDLKLAKEELRKKLSLDSDNFFQRGPKSTGIRVNKGDQIRIKAGGVMEWTNWNKSSTPQGLSSQGSWNSIKSGTLIACIGKDQNNEIEGAIFGVSVVEYC